MTANNAFERTVRTSWAASGRGTTAIVAGRSTRLLGVNGSISAMRQWTDVDAVRLPTNWCATGVTIDSPAQGHERMAALSSARRDFRRGVIFEVDWFELSVRRVMVEAEPVHLWRAGLFVRRQFRRRGIGRQAIEWLCAIPGRGSPGCESTFSWEILWATNFGEPEPYSITMEMEGQLTANNAFERTVRHRGPRLSAAQPSWPAAQRDR